MPTIEQVSKQVFSDKSWSKKCAIGCLLSLIPIVNLLALGYLYRMFIEGRNARSIARPEGDDFKGLFLDGLRFFVVGLIFAGLPMALAILLAEYTVESELARLPLIPILFVIGPLWSAALYLYSVKQDISDCFSVDALNVMLRKSLVSYTVPTLAFLGLCLLIVAPLGYLLQPFPFFFGGVFYFYLMGSVFRDLEIRARR